MEKETNLLSLKSNPIFQLSLASKELFHSNFLFWLSQDDNLRPYFEYVIDSLCGKGNEIKWEDLGEYVVLREYKNFDLCICKKIVPIKENENITQEPDENEEEEIKEEGEAANYDDISHAGEFYLVIENKFKSIANKSQLDKYYNYVKKNNQKRFKYRHKIEHAEINEAIQKNIDVLNKKIIQRKEELGNNNKLIKKDPSIVNLRKEQKELEKHKVTCPKNIDIQTKFVLLTLAQTFGERKAIDNKKIWKIRTYEEYAQFLSNSLLDINDEKLTTFNVSFQIIFNYIRFIRTFSLEINKHLGEIDLIKNSWNAIFDDHDQIFKSIRCSDIWQKMAMHKIAQELMGKDEIKKTGYEIDMDSTDKHILELDNPSNRIYIGVQYFHSLALLEIKYWINEKCMFCIQQQGKSLAAGIVIMTDRTDFITSNKKNKNAWKEEVEAFWKSCNMDNIVTSGSSDEIYAYESKDKKDGFYYKKIIFNSSENTKDNGDSTIENTLIYMVDCLNRADKEYSQKRNNYSLDNIKKAIKQILQQNKINLLINLLLRIAMIPLPRRT